MPTFLNVLVNSLIKLVAACVIVLALQPDAKFTTALMVWLGLMIAELKITFKREGWW